jgi:hypothetical protein
MAERTHFGLARIARETVPAFELYDLRIEVIGPPDRAIYCGARLVWAALAIFRPRTASSS